MWGHILTEASTRQNFNFGFSSYKSEILVHLSQWQYWWWFWFGVWWALYYFITLKVITKKTFNFNVTLNTSIRGRGKWGDFLVALIPISWCCNILINSNFILRMIEWQNESSLFTIRVQGKQWYWAYKYDPSTFQSIVSTPKNIGHDRWQVSSGIDSLNADTYYQAINLTSQLEFQKSYLFFLTKNETNKIFLEKEFLTSEPLLYSSNYSLNYSQRNNSFDKNFLQSNKSNLNILVTNIISFYKEKNSFKDTLDYSSFLKDVKNPLISLNNISNIETFSKLNYTSLAKFINDFSFYTDIQYSGLDLNNHNYYYNHSSLDDTEDTNANYREELSTQPFRVVKGILNSQVLDTLNSSTNLSKLLFINFKLYQGGDSLSDKDSYVENFWGFRQKKYKRVKKFSFKEENIYDSNTFNVIGKKNIPTHSSLDIVNSDLLSIDKLKYTNESFLEKRKSLNNNLDQNSINYRAAVKLNRHRSELVPVTLARRLLRTKRTLVIPAHVNITVITNSYDVVHSWFIPGLGLKMDCVPGRSTHHTFYVDNIGFYYGQCAEICGRYHHHMPIRLCALPFEQFVVWWNSKNRLSRFNEVDLSSKSTKGPNTLTKTMIIKKNY